MKTAIPGFCRWVLLSLLVILSHGSNAGHMLGTDITYYYTGTPNTYTVMVRWYRDCMGITGSQQISICYSSVNAGVSNTVSIQRLPGQNYLPQFPYWPPITTSCYGGSAPGIELIIYEGQITLPSAQSDWILSYSTFPANIGIGQNFMYVSTKIDNLNYPTNSSISYTYNPTFIYCVNQPAWDNFAAADVDGDSLSYHLIPILDNTIVCPPAPFINPIPPFSPLVSSTPISMDSTNGSLTFTPTQVGTAMVSARVDEFRNGILINSSSIEHVMYLVTGCIISHVEEFHKSTIQISPNPVSDNITIRNDGQEQLFFIEAIDVAGKTYSLNLFPVTSGAWNADISELSPGMYLLKATGNEKVYTVKFIKE